MSRRVPSRAMTGSGSSSRWNYRRDAVEALVSWGTEQLSGGRPSRASTSRSRSSEAVREARSSRSPTSSGVSPRRPSRFSWSPCATGRPGRSGCSSSTIPRPGDRPRGARAARSRTPRGVRARAPPMAAARHRPALPRAPATRPADASPRAVRSIRCRCFAVTPVPVRGEVRGTGDMCARRELRTTRRG